MRNFNDWWKNPVLQGEDNDYGQYDYLINDLPQDYARWEKGESRCDSCGKHRKLNFRAVQHFYTMDGYDYMDYTECWVCVLKNKWHHIKHVIKKPINLKISTFVYCNSLYKTRVETNRSGLIGKYRIYKTCRKEAQDLLDICGGDAIIRYTKKIKNNKKKGV